jgi:hypothetical protein
MPLTVAKTRIMESVTLTGAGAAVPSSFFDSWLAVWVMLFFKGTTANAPSAFAYEVAIDAAATPLASTTGYLAVGVTYITLLGSPTVDLSAGYQMFMHPAAAIALNPAARGTIMVPQIRVKLTPHATQDCVVTADAYVAREGPVPFDPYGVPQVNFI